MSDELSSGGVSRRAVVAAAAWSVPVVSVAVATPAMAASESFDVGVTGLGSAGSAVQPFDQVPVRTEGGQFFYDVAGVYDTHVFFQNVGSVVPAGATFSLTMNYYPVAGASIVIQAFEGSAPGYGFSSSTVVPVGGPVLVGAPVTGAGTATQTFRFDVPIPAGAVWSFQMRFPVGDVPEGGATVPGSISASVVLPAGTVDANPANDTVERSDIGYVPRVVTPGVVTFSPPSYSSPVNGTYGAITGSVGANSAGVRPSSIDLTYSNGYSGPAPVAVNTATGAFSITGVKAAATVGTGSVTGATTGYTAGAAALVTTVPAEYDIVAARLSSPSSSVQPLNETPVRVVNGASYYRGPGTYTTTAFLRNDGSEVPAGASFKIQTTVFPSSGARIELAGFSNEARGYGFNESSVVPAGPVTRAFLLNGTPCVERTFRFDVPLPAGAAWTFTMLITLGAVASGQVQGAPMSMFAYLPAGLTDSHQNNQTYQAWAAVTS